MSEKVQDTVLSTLTDNLVDSFFESGASSANVVTPSSEEDSEAGTENKPKNLDQSIKNPLDDGFSTDELIGDLLKTPEDALEPVIEEEKKGPGRPKKQEQSSFDFNSLISDELLLPFDDEAPVSSVDDLKELIKANKEYERSKGKEEALKDYKDNLPESINLILDYAENGGQDFDTFLKALGQVKQVTDLNLDKPSDHKEIIRQYYTLQDWTNQEIDEHIEELLDLGEEKLKSVASKLKPKLDQRQEELLQSQLEDAKRIKEQQEKAQRAYVTNVTNTLKKGVLGDLKISKEEQKDLYKALVEERYQSVSGGTTNRLGAWLDKIQFIEPDYDLLAQVMLLLDDPKAFKAKIREEVKKEVTADTVKKIKSEQGLGKNGSNIETPSTSSRLRRLDSNFKNPFE